MNLSRHSLLKRHRETNTKIATQLLGIKAELEQGKVAPVFQLLRLSKVWIEEHMHLESEWECEDSAEKDKFSFVRRALVNHPSAITVSAAAGHGRS